MNLLTFGCHGLRWAHGTVGESCGCGRSASYYPAGQPAAGDVLRGGGLPPVSGVDGPVVPAVRRRGMGLLSDAESRPSDRGAVMGRVIRPNKRGPKPKNAEK